MTLRNILLAGTALGAAVFMTAPAFAASNTQAELDALKAQIEALQRKIDDVEIHHGNAIKTLEERKSDVEVTLKNGRPEFKSASGAYSLAITGRAHLDWGGYDQDDASSANFGGLRNNINFRRAILGVTGTLAKDFAYDLHFNFGDSGNEKSGELYEAALHYKGIDGVTLSIGAIQPKLTLDDSTSSNDITFMERATAANLMTSIGGGDGRMAVGGTFNNDNIFAAAYYTMGSVTGTADDDTSSALGRVAYATSPAEGLNVHIGVSGTQAFNLPNDTFRFRDRPELRVDATRMIDTGDFTAVDSITAYGPEIAFNYGPFRAQGEYYRYEIDQRGTAVDPDFSAWYLQASWIISGESYKYDIKKGAYSGVKPANPFTSVTGGFGAWEVAVRYSQADLTDTVTANNRRGGEQDIITVGLNWYANSNVRFMLNYLDVDVEDRANVANPNFGHQALALRTQFAF
ncbi:porin [Parvibaculum sp.]|uniref:porin n=1 Tax=Parvibaculum sp. TaxID=2024848 RepID=UPI0027315B2B|nr:porin [Parvibaculum sp.]MDP1626149.1 porin [Parvibaculum sp.]MDP2151466.1 porin [Parvibaculum sp.]MDP3329204.1 porin [Parvibaculum sp.]